jgi:hypothetical protein
VYVDVYLGGFGWCGVDPVSEATEYLGCDAGDHADYIHSIPLGEVDSARSYARTQQRVLSIPGLWVSWSQPATLTSGGR